MRRKSLMTPTRVGCGFACKKVTPLMVPIAPGVVRFTTAGTEAGLLTAAIAADVASPVIAGTERSSRHSSRNLASEAVLWLRDAKAFMGATSSWWKRGPAGAAGRARCTVLETWRRTAGGTAA